MAVGILQCSVSQNRSERQAAIMNISGDGFIPPTPPRSSSSAFPPSVPDSAGHQTSAKNNEDEQFGMTGLGMGNQGTWERVIPRVGQPPCQRSLHAAAVWNNSMFIFGGYDGQQRVNDLHSFDFNTSTWSLVTNSQDSAAPSPRDRHVAVVWGSGFFVFGGFDGSTRVNDTYLYDLVNKQWSVLQCGGAVPSPRHSHAAVVYKDSMYVFGGYDGSYRCDFHEFNFHTRTWSLVPSVGKVPMARYRGTCVVHGETMILHGGHDGHKHLQDTHIYDFCTRSWSEVVASGAGA